MSDMISDTSNHGRTYNRGRHPSILPFSEAHRHMYRHNLDECIDYMDDLQTDTDGLVHALAVLGFPMKTYCCHRWRALSDNGYRHALLWVLSVSVGPLVPVLVYSAAEAVLSEERTTATTGWLLTGAAMVG